ncbi:hypothetical protein JCM10212_001823 [Sporobolomyces blumeae]
MRRSRPFHPPSNRESYKDLLIFEERLKQNAERLQKQRRKYQGFLFSLTSVIVYLAYLVFVQPSIYSLVHYSNVACLLVAATTLVLFFVTGMYSEKIAYAYKFVPQANRALRPFNIYLNTRHKSRFAFLNPFRSSSPSSTAARPTTTTTASPASSPRSSSPALSRQTSGSSIRSATSVRSAGALHSSASSSSGDASSPSPPASPRLDAVPLPEPDDGPVTRATPVASSSSSSSTSPARSPSLRSATSPAQGIPIPPIPPAQNPRGELIFSSRVSPTFREGYERYRGEWERRRKEAKDLARHEKAKSSRWTSVKRWMTWGRGGGGDETADTSRLGGTSGQGRVGGAGSFGGEKDAERGRTTAGRADRSRESSASLSSAGEPLSSQVHSRAASRERPPDRPAFGRARRESASSAAEGVVSSVSTPRTESPARTRPSSPASHRTPGTYSGSTLAPLSTDRSRYDTTTSTPPPSSDLSPAASGLAAPFELKAHETAGGGGAIGRIRAESFSELLELEATEPEQGSEFGPPGPGLSRSASYMKRTPSGPGSSRI